MVASILMRRLLGSGVWEIFLPEVREGAHYKFELRTVSGRRALVEERSVRLFQSVWGKENLIAGLQSGALSMGRRGMDGEPPEPKSEPESGQHL